MSPELILPSQIPWSEIKGVDLEELLYWLFDSMGAKDLEWRIGGQGSGAADQGRDLELSFFTPSPDGTLTKQKWWVEAKGSANTVAPKEIHEAVNNIAGKYNIDVFVIATNSIFSNPTRDWVKEWQSKHPRPTVKLWQKPDLENLCSKNPLAVIRLYAKALSPQGKVEVVRSKLWEYVSFSDEPTLSDIWKERENISIDERALFSLVASEIANGDIGIRSWALHVNEEILVSSLTNGFISLFNLAIRANDMGVRQEPLIRAMSYLIIVAIHRIGQPPVSDLLSNVWESVEGREYPDDDNEIILKPVLGALKTELTEVCSRDCQRVICSGRLQDSEIINYWNRLNPKNLKATKDESILTIESVDKPCKVGFSVSKENRCPLNHIDISSSAIDEFIRVVDEIVRYRSSEAKDV